MEERSWGWINPGDDLAILNRILQTENEVYIVNI